jgi:hypothetical protein
MNPTVEDVVRKALELDERGRAEVVDRLRRSIEDEEDAEVGASSRAPEPQRSERFETKVFDLGPCRLKNLDDIAKALAFAEGEASYE